MGSWIEKWDENLAATKGYFTPYKHSSTYSIGKGNFKSEGGKSVTTLQIHFPGTI